MYLTRARGNITVTTTANKSPLKLQKKKTKNLTWLRLTLCPHQQLMREFDNNNNNNKGEIN